MNKDNIIGSRVVTTVDLLDTHIDMRDGSWSEGSMAGSVDSRVDFKRCLKIFICVPHPYTAAEVLGGAQVITVIR